jgi:hypothetical protein
MKMLAKMTLLGCLLIASFASADDRHPALDSKFYVSVGGYFASRVLKASADGSITPSAPSLHVDFDSDLNLDDSPQLAIAEFRWQFAEKWNLGLQYFSSTRAADRILDGTIEWDDVTYEVGAAVAAKTSVDITRVVVSRHFRRKGGHDFRLAAGLHWLDVSARIEGEATLDDGTTAFAASKASASLPIPNVGALYQYSPSQKWLLSARVDWFSASIGDYSGGIWNTNLSVNYQLAKHVGIGLGYQFFQINGTLTEDRWKGDLKMRFSGPTFQVSGFW